MFGVRIGQISTFRLVILIYVGLMLPFSVYMLTNFFRTIPASMIEAAVIDGASSWRVFRADRAAALGGAARHTRGRQPALGLDELLIALVFLQDDSKKTLMVGITGFQSRYSLNVPAIMAGLTLATLPIITVYIFGQRFFVRGLVAGALKGDDFRERLGDRACGRTPSRADAAAARGAVRGRRRGAVPRLRPCLLHHGHQALRQRRLERVGHGNRGRLTVQPIVDTTLVHEGMTGIAMEGDRLRLTLFPDAGAKILDLVHRPTGREERGRTRACRFAARIPEPPSTTSGAAAGTSSSRPIRRARSATTPSTTMATSGTGPGSGRSRRTTARRRPWPCAGTRSLFRA